MQRKRNDTVTAILYYVAKYSDNLLDKGKGNYDSKYKLWQFTGENAL